MIRHIVLVRFAPATPDAERAAIFADLGALRGVVPGLRAFSGGPNASREGLTQGFTHAFTVDFDDEAARDAYLVHPAHQAAGEPRGDRRRGRRILNGQARPRRERVGSTRWATKLRSSACRLAGSVTCSSTPSRHARSRRSGVDPSASMACA